MAEHVSRFDVNDVIEYREGIGPHRFGRVESVKFNRNGVFYGIEGESQTRTQGGYEERWIPEKDIKEKYKVST